MRVVAAKVVVAVLSLASLAWAASPQFSAQKRIGLKTGDQWEPAVSADNSGHIFVLYPQYGRVPGCKDCHVPSMLLVASNDNGKTWQEPRVMLNSGSGQFDAQIAVDPADHHTLYAAWLENRKREVMLARSVDSGQTWAFTIAARSDEQLDKPALAVRGQNVYLAFNHEEEVWVAVSQDSGRSFFPARVNAESLAGWSLLGSAVVDPAGNVYLAWSAYSKAVGARGMVNLYVSRSTDNGKTWTAKRIDNSAAAPGCEEEECSEGYLGAQIAVTSDSDGTLYALWSAGHSSREPQRIYFSSSTDGGENWLPRVGVSYAEPGVEHAFPAIAAGSAGDVRIAWMDARNTSPSRKTPYWNTYYRSSSNGGATWADEIRLSGYVPGYRYIAKQGFRFPFGDYFGMAIDSRGDTQVVWGEGLNYQSPGSIWHAMGR